MFELAITVLITGGSAVLLCYWFRYTCVLILSAKTASDYSSQFAMDHQLNFLGVQTSVRSHATLDLNPLRDALDRDYDVVKRLLDRAQVSAEDSSIERRMLAAHYRLLHSWYRVSRQFSPRCAREAIEEMALVVAHFANSLGECAASAA